MLPGRRHLPVARAAASSTVEPGDHRDAPAPVARTATDAASYEEFAALVNEEAAKALRRCAG